LSRTSLASLFYLNLPLHPPHPPFPYTTLFRSGLRFNERLAKIHFWVMFIAFNSTFGPLFALGLMGMPRRVATYASNLQPLNIWVDRKSTRLNSSHQIISYAVFCLKKKIK